MSEERTFTQDDVNKIVQERLAKEKAKYDADFAKRDTELQARELRLKAREVLGEKGLPVELLDALNISSQEAFEQSLAIIEKNMSQPKPEPAPAHTMTVSTGGSHNENVVFEDSIRKAAGLD